MKKIEGSIKNLDIKPEALSKEGKTKALFKKNRTKLAALGLGLAIATSTLTGCGTGRDISFATANQGFNLQTRVTVRSLLDDEIKYQLEGYYYVSSTETYFRFMGEDENGNTYRIQINKSPLVVINIEQGRNLENFMSSEQENESEYSYSKTLQ